MGGLCCVQKRLDTSVDWIRESLPVALSDDVDVGVRFAPRVADMESPERSKKSQTQGRDDFAEEVAFQIALDRQGDFRERRSG